jgi:hypothetical protein
VENFSWNIDPVSLTAIERGSRLECGVDGGHCRSKWRGMTGPPPRTSKINFTEPDRGPFLLGNRRRAAGLIRCEVQIEVLLRLPT